MIKIGMLLTEIFGKKYVIKTSGGNYPALLSQNVKPNEDLWRLTIFGQDKDTGEFGPIKHFSMNENEAGNLAARSKLSKSLEIGTIRFFASVGLGVEYQGIVPI